MRNPVVVRPNFRQRQSATQSMPAPVGGWNARDALAAMKITDAVALDNFFPKTTYCEVRGGSVQHTASAVINITTESGLGLATEDGDLLVTEDPVSLIAGNIKTLAVYSGMDNVSKFFAMTNTGVYDVSSGGAVGAALIARTDGKHQHTMFGDGSNNWLIAANGVDKVLYYNGTTWTAVDSGTSPALSGLDTTRIIGVTKHKGRLYFIEKGSLSMWYLAAGAAGGALTELDLSPNCKRGGFLMAVHSWTRDAGDGQDDVLVCLTSEGEALVFQGNNPSSAANWSLIGTFYIGKPIGRRCLEQYGGELVVLTENGAYPLSAALLTGAVSYEKALSDKIVKAFTDSARSAGGVFGWEAKLFPAQQALLVNVPASEDGVHYQYVMNTQTKAWCRFTDWHAETFAVFNKELYFARGTIVYHAWTGASDSGTNINWYGKQAYSQFNYSGMKQALMFRPLFSSNASVNYTSAIDVDFDESKASGSSVTSNTGSLAIWGNMTWGNFFWGGGFTTLKPWGSTSNHPGYWLSGKVRGATNVATIQWMASDMVYQHGGVL